MNDLARYSESVLCSIHLVELRLIQLDPTVSPLFVAICGGICRVAVNRNTLYRKFLFTYVYGFFSRVAISGVTVFSL